MNENEEVKCFVCQQPFPKERQELLKVNTCVKCTKQKKLPIGVMLFPENFHERTEGPLGIVLLEQE